MNNKKSFRSKPKITMSETLLNKYVDFCDRCQEYKNIQHLEHYTMTHKQSGVVFTRYFCPNCFKNIAGSKWINELRSEEFDNLVREQTTTHRAIDNWQNYKYSSYPQTSWVYNNWKKSPDYEETIEALYEIAKKAAGLPPTPIVDYDKRKEKEIEYCQAFQKQEIKNDTPTRLFAVLVVIGIIYTVFKFYTG